MKIVIIEDERLMADDLAESIVKQIPDAQIAAKLYSVKEVVKWFEKNRQPDLIFSDIQLGDGLSFEIFGKLHITAPAIFCTAYDEYARQYLVNRKAIKEVSQYFARKLSVTLVVPFQEKILATY